jgi:hypothetical protein
LLEKIGVHENGEEGKFARELWDIIRAQPIKGEMQVGFVVSDGKYTQKLAFPAKGYYSLMTDEVIYVNSLLFETEEVGDSLKIFATAYEQDGGFKEQLIYKVLDIATGKYIGNPAGLVITLAGIDFSKIYADIFGAEDDWMGSYVTELNVSNNWGVGQYSDIKCKRENGNIGLRIWYKIECPVYDYSLRKALP